MWIIAISIEIALVCGRAPARKVPTNYILLFVFTGCMTFLLTFIASFYTFQSTIIAAGMTAIVTVSLSVLAWIARDDFKFIMGAVLVGLIGVIMMILFSLLFIWPNW